MSDNDVLGKLTAVNGKNLSGVQVEGEWYNCKPPLLEAALGHGLKPGDTVKLTMKGTTKEFINIMRIDKEALNAAKNDSTGVKVLDNSGKVLYEINHKEQSKDDLIIRQVAAKCATEIASALKLNQQEWVGWANHVNKWIKGDE